MSYEIVQSVFRLSMAANGVADQKLTQVNAVEFLKIYLNGGTYPGYQNYQGAIPQLNAVSVATDWAVEWGPAVVTAVPDNESLALNSMYVAYSQTLNTYVIAVAATDPDSLQDWATEDLNVETQVAWTVTSPWSAPFTKNSIPPAPGQPGISKGTALGILNLLGMTAPTLAEPNTDISLETYLESIPTSGSSPTTVIVAGHSLGGALAPTLALYLQGEFSAKNWQFLTLPTAGASPGNPAFANLLAQPGNLPPTPSNCPAPMNLWNVDYANSRDAVPHAWNQLDELIGQIDANNYPTVWGVVTKDVKDVLQPTINTLKALTGGLSYSNITQQMFVPNWGQWQWNENQPVWTALTVYTDEKPMGILDVLEITTFFSAAHIDQYDNFFGVTPAQKMQLASS